VIFPRSARKRIYGPQKIADFENHCVERLPSSTHATWSEGQSPSSRRRVNGLTIARTADLLGLLKKIRAPGEETMDCDGEEIRGWTILIPVRY
jgi:hypothetical protein